MAQLTIAAVAGHFNRDVAFALTRVEAICDDARERGAQLVVLPDAALGGYLSYAHIDRPLVPALVPAMELAVDPPPALSLDGPEVKAVRASAADLVVCFGLCEADGPHRYNTAVCVTGDGVL